MMLRMLYFLQTWEYSANNTSSWWLKYHTRTSSFNESYFAFYTQECRNSVIRNYFKAVQYFIWLVCTSIPLCYQNLTVFTCLKIIFLFQCFAHGYETHFTNCRFYSWGMLLLICLGCDENFLCEKTESECIIHGKYYFHKLLLDTCICICV